MWLIKDAFQAILSALTALAAWFFLAPVAYFWPRNNRLVVVIGRENGLFLDNCKYFFAEGVRQKNPPVSLKFYTSDQGTRSRLQPWRDHLIFSPGLKSFFTLLRAGIVVVDSAEWVKSGKYQLTLGAKIVQLWHGAPLKEIELPLHEKRVRSKGRVFGCLYDWLKKISVRYPRVDLFVSCSPFFTDKAFSRQFHASSFIDSGFPRNDIFYTADKLTGPEKQLFFINVNVETTNYIIKLKHAGRHILLYAPTFRKEKDNPFLTGMLDLERLNIFCETNGITIIFKLHPLMQGQYTMDQHEHLVDYEPHYDIYPLMEHTDLLITDYSSIYFDYLLLDKPIVFYPYDFESYTQDDRELLFDYNEMTPGPKCFEQSTLEAAILSELYKPDHFTLQRKKIREITFLHRDGKAARRVWDAVSSLVEQ